MGVLNWLFAPANQPELPAGADGRLGPREVTGLFTTGIVSLGGRVDYVFYPDGSFHWDEGREQGMASYEIRADGTIAYKFGTLRLSRRAGVLLASGTESWLRDIEVGWRATDAT